MDKLAYGNEYRSTIVCVDGYENRVFRGRFINSYCEGEIPFHSLMEFLLQMEKLLDTMQFPQSFMEKRTFLSNEESILEVADQSGSWHGQCATFDVKVLFRQNASWQGSVTWLEMRREESFRSTLELLLLMHSALSKIKE